MTMMSSQFRSKMTSKGRCSVDADVHVTRIGRWGGFHSVQYAKEVSKKRRRRFDKRMVDDELERPVT